MSLFMACPPVGGRLIMFLVAGYVSNRGPVIFSATYPFLYFVMDTNIHVALMAGKMVDPLNTRILY